MPRKPRLHVPGGFYHVILRGNGRQDIFFDPVRSLLVACNSYIDSAWARLAHRGCVARRRHSAYYASSSCLASARDPSPRSLPIWLLQATSAHLLRHLRIAAWPAPAPQTISRKNYGHLKILHGPCRG